MTHHSTKHTVRTSYLWAPLLPSLSLADSSQEKRKCPSPWPPRPSTCWFSPQSKTSLDYLCTHLMWRVNHSRSQINQVSAGEDARIGLKSFKVPSNPEVFWLKWLSTEVLLGIKLSGSCHPFHAGSSLLSFEISTDHISEGDHVKLLSISNSLAWIQLSECINWFFHLPNRYRVLTLP